MSFKGFLLLGIEIIKKLKGEIPSVEYERYFKNLRFDEEASKTNSIVYIAQNLFVANWIKTRYSERIATLYELETGVKPVVSVLIASSTPENTTNTNTKSQQKNPSTKVQKIAVLNPSYTFESFVVGSSNQFAYKVSKTVADAPGETYNPLLIWGQTGIGKTHMLNAIGNAHPTKNVIYVTSEQFVNDLIYHLQNRIMDRFQEKYRNCDFLLVDDVQFFSGKPKVQEEFFHTFNELRDKKKQIVLTADKPPKQIAGIEERLKSRFEWGMIVDIQPPEHETKMAIIKKKCEMDGIFINNEVIDYIALNIDNNREIEGVILKLSAYSNMTNQEMNIELAKIVLKEKIKERKENISLEQIINVTAKELNIKPSEIKSKSRSTNIANARRIVIYLAKTLTPNSQLQLAQFFGMKDHSSISHAMKKINETIDEDHNFKIMIDNLKNRITTQNSE